MKIILRHDGWVVIGTWGFAERVVYGPANVFSCCRFVKNHS